MSVNYISIKREKSNVIGQCKNILAMSTWNDRAFVWFEFRSKVVCDLILLIKHGTENLHTHRSFQKVGKDLGSIYFTSKFRYLDVEA